MAPFTKDADNQQRIINKGPIKMTRFFYLASVVGLCILAGCSAPVSNMQSDGEEGGVGEAVVANSFADIPIAANDAIDVEKSLLINSGDYWLGRAVLRSSLDSNAAFEYYQSSMPQYDWISITTVQSKVSVLSFEKASRVATVQIDGAGSRGSYIVITVSPREAIR